MIEVICGLCNLLISNSFYLCPKFHILCQNCYKIDENHVINLCSICNSMLILYKITHESKSNSYESRILNNAYKCGPVVFLNNISVSQLQLMDSKGVCESSRPNCLRWIRCVICYKCLSSTRIREHYNHEHRNLFICPVPTKATISIALHYENVGLSELKDLQMFTTTNQSDEVDSEKVFSVMATKVPFRIPTLHDFYYVILIWLYSQYHACDVIYTIQAIDENRKFPIVSFTGQPMDSEFMENLIKGDSTIEEFGQYLVMKKSSFNNAKGSLSEAIINVTIDKY